MDKQMRPFITGDGARLEPDGYACMSYIWDSAHPEARPGVVRTLGLRASLSAPRWTHAVSEVTWSWLCYLSMPVTSEDSEDEDEISQRHEELVALLQSKPWPHGLQDAVERWGISPLSRALD